MHRNAFICCRIKPASFPGRFSIKPGKSALGTRLESLSSEVTMETSIFLIINEAKEPTSLQLCVSQLHDRFLNIPIFIAFHFIFISIIA